MKKQPTINPNDFVSVESGSEDVYVPLNEEIDVYDVDKAIDEVNGVVVAGSTEDKVEYLDETKTDIREAIINKGVEVGEDDPFRSYAEKIGEIEGGEVHNQDKTITENGTYTYDEGYTGLGEVVVEVPQDEPVLETLNVVENGTYTPSGNMDGYDEVVVDVPQATLGELSVTENGVYEPTSVDGYNRVEVDVNPPLQDKTITTNGTFTADSGYYGLDEVTVDIDTVNNQDKTITENGTYTADSGYTGLGTVVVNTPVVNNENKTIRVNGTYTAGAGYTGLGEVVVDVADIPAVVEPLSVSPTTSQQIITPPANVDGFNQVTVGAVTSSIDANITSANIVDGVSILGVTGSAEVLDGEQITITPTTSQQVITPSGNHNGITEATVSAVTSAIDSNISAGNIKSGVSILGVAGSVEELNADDSLIVIPAKTGQTIRPTSPYNAFSEVGVLAVTSSIDSNIQAGNIKSGVSILGVNGNVVEANETTLNVTPSTSAQTLTPTGAYTGFDEVNVSAVTSSIDANITAGNIKDGVTILGVQGTYTGGGITPTGTKNITENGVYDITNYASVDVAVPTTAPTYYIPKAVDANGQLVNGSSLIDFTGVTSVGLRTLCYAYMYSTFPANTVFNMGLVRSIGSSACQGMFYSSSGIVAVDMSAVESIATNGCDSMFYGNTSITSADLGLLETVGYMGCKSMFSSCSGLITANLGSLRTFSDSSAMESMFSYCSALTNVNVSSVEDGNKSYVFRQMFNNCRNLTTVRWSSLTELTGDNAFSGAFGNSGLTSLYFPSLSSTGFGTKTNQFQAMLSGTSGCTVHFPSNLQSVIGSWSDVVNGFRGGNTTVLFDLPATVTLVGTNSYYRNPKYDTATALAWFDTSATRATPYYTSGTTDPVVNDAIYSDASCTTQVDTIASIS
ncbi:MAG: leucine-rich repeat protein [Prevotella sp.]|nr:leucine-rich repeat protein [Prevotella sp.]